MSSQSFRLSHEINTGRGCGLFLLVNIFLYPKYKRDDKDRERVWFNQRIFCLFSSLLLQRNSSGEFIFSLVQWQLQSPMKLSSLITSTSVFIFIILEIRVLLLPCTAVPWCYNMTRQMKDSNAHIVQSGLSFKSDGIAKLLYPIDLSAINLARVMSSSKKIDNKSNLSWRI
jgi:hypothetical protein